MNEIVSVIIPIYNIKNYIRRCIESVIQQTYTNIEIIIVDDGSIDDSGEICKQFVTMDSRIIYIYQGNQGSVGARKTGLLYAKGNYIVFVDGDDYVEKVYVERLYECMVKNDVDFVHSNYMVNGKNQKFTKHMHLYKERELHLDFRINLLRNYVFEWETEKEIIECNLYGCIYKKKVIYDCYMTLPDSQQYGEDLLCLCNLIMRCRSMMLIPNAYYHYVLREGSLDHSGDFMKALSDKISLYEELKKILTEYQIISALIDKCQMFFVQKIIGDFRLISSAEIQLKKNYVCEFTDLLLDKKIILYGAGVVGESLYKQLTNYKNIEIISWMDFNFRNIHSSYREIDNPDLISTLSFDYVVIAVERKSVADEIIDYISQMNVDKKLLLCQPYSKGVSLSIL